MALGNSGNNILSTLWGNKSCFDDKGKGTYSVDSNTINKYPILFSFSLQAGINMFIPTSREFIPEAACLSLWLLAGSNTLQMPDLM